MKKYDVIVLGAGILGLSCTYALARAGLRVLCLEQFFPCHNFASSSGQTRLFRKAYFEEQRYIPLLDDAFRRWKDLEEKSQKQLLIKNGFLVMSETNNAINHRLVEAAHAYDIKIERLTQRQIATKYSGIFSIPSTHEGSFEENASIILVDNSLFAFKLLAEEASAQFRFQERVENFFSNKDFVEVTSDKNTYQAQSIVIAAGPFINKFSKILPMEFTVNRAVSLWFHDFGRQNVDKGLPSFAFVDAQDFIYGFPSIDGSGVKLSRYQPSTKIIDPLSTSLEPTEDEIAPIMKARDAYLPKLAQSFHQHRLCFYTLTKDENFLIDRHPQHSNIIFAAGCSGHAFKFAPVVGELVKRLVQDEALGFDIDFLRVRSPTS